MNDVIMFRPLIAQDVMVDVKLSPEELMRIDISWAESTDDVKMRILRK